MDPVIIAALIAAVAASIPTIATWRNKRAIGKTSARIGIPNGHGTVSEMLTTVIEKQAIIGGQTTVMAAAVAEASAEATRVREELSAARLHLAEDRKMMAAHIAADARVAAWLGVPPEVAAGDEPTP